MHALRMQVTTEEIVIRMSDVLDDLPIEQSTILSRAITDFMEFGSSWQTHRMDEQVRELYDRTVMYLKDPRLFEEFHKP